MSKILIGQQGTAYTFVAGSKQITVSGLWFTPSKSSVKILNETSGKVLAAFTKRNLTITSSGANYIIDYSANANAPALVAGDMLTVEISQPAKEDTIISAISVVQTSVDAINNQKTTFTNNITVKAGSICQYTVLQDGIISTITGAAITKIEKGIGNIVNLPLTVQVGDIITITTNAAAPFTLIITNVISSKQFNNSQNYGVSPSRYLFGPTYFQKSAYLNDNLILAAVGAANMVFYNGQFIVEKVSVNNVSGFYSQYPYLANKTVDYSNKLYFIDISLGIFKYDYITKAVTLVYSTANPKNIVKVNVSGGYKLYVSSIAGLLMINPDTDVVTVVNVTNCQSVHYYPNNGYIYVCPLTGGNLLCINPVDDSIVATIALTGSSTNNLGFSTYKPGLNRLFLANITQTGGSNIYVINTANNTQESIININNSNIGGILYSSVSDTIYLADSSMNVIYRYNPSTLASIGNLSPGNGAYHILIQGNYLYVLCSGSTKVVIYDMRDHSIARTEIVAASCYKLFYDDIRNLILAFSPGGNIINEILP